MLENESKMYAIFYLDAKVSERGISNMRVARLLVITEVIMIYSVHKSNDNSYHKKNKINVQ